MGKRIPMTSGDEYDRLTRGGRRVHANNHQENGKVKRRYRRRERRHSARIEQEAMQEAQSTLEERKACYTAIGRIEAMQTGRELDALVAERVMGLQLVKAPKVWSDDDWLTSDTPTETEALGVVNPNWKPGDWTPPFSTILPYSTDIAAAWQVVEKMRADGWWYTLTNVQERQEFAEFRRVAREGVHKFHYTRGETPQHAICLAALAAVGHKIQEEQP